MVVGLRVCKCEAESGVGPKTTKPSTTARFQVCRVKRLRKVMGAGSDVVWVSCCCCWGCAFVNARGESGLGAKNHET